MLSAKERQKPLFNKVAKIKGAKDNA
jgi:hypothetical protein